MRYTIQFSSGSVHFEINGEQCEIIDCRGRETVYTPLTVAEARTQYREMMAVAPAELQATAANFKVGDHVAIRNLGLAVVKWVDRTLNSRGYELSFYHGKAKGTVGNGYSDRDILRRI